MPGAADSDPLIRNAAQNWHHLKREKPAIWRARWFYIEKVSYSNDIRIYSFALHSEYFWYIFAIYMKELLNKCSGFEWDEGNAVKNWIRHQVTQGECEQVFFNEPLIVASDEKHSEKEKRWFVLGQTDSDRLLFLVFTIRKNLIRVISSRDMNKKEREIYNEQA